MWETVTNSQKLRDCIERKARKTAKDKDGKICRKNKHPMDMA